jgi:hypothetical protein
MFPRTRWMLRLAYPPDFPLMYLRVQVTGMPRFHWVPQKLAGIMLMFQKDADLLYGEFSMLCVQVRTYTYSWEAWPGRIWRVAGIFTRIFARLKYRVPPKANGFSIGHIGPTPAI